MIGSFRYGARFRSLIVMDVDLFSGGSPTDAGQKQSCGTNNGAAACEASKANVVRDDTWARQKLARLMRFVRQQSPIIQHNVRAASVVVRSSHQGRGATRMGMS